MTAEDIRGRVIDFQGSFPTWWEDLEELDPRFADAFSRYVSAAFGSDELPRHVRELLLLAHDTTVTVLDAEGVQLRVGRALEAGATEHEVLDVLELMPFIALHGLTSGLPLVFDPSQYEVPQSTRGPYWEPFEERFPGVHGMMAVELPVFFDAYRGLGEAVWDGDGLEPRWRELVLVVADMSTTHLFTEGAALHVQNALRYGATPAQIVAALALTVTFATRALELGVTALANYRNAAATTL
jgi:alkylhydroperoxidase/carboxymuconolactone decarboxylase family protein YurZ